MHCIELVEMGCKKLTYRFNENQSLLKLAYSSREAKWSRKNLKTSVETGLYYYGARYYNPSTSVWLSVDPLASSYPSHDPYNFVMGNPIMLVDPDGRSANPVYGSDGLFRGNTSEGFTGEIIIYDGNANFSNMTHGQLVGSDIGASYLTNIDGAMNVDAMKNIFNHVASEFDGTWVLGEQFSINRLESGEIGFSDDVNANFTTKVYGSKEKVLGSSFDIDAHYLNYEYSVENIQATLVGHEFFAHGIKGVGDLTNNHWKAYLYTAQYMKNKASVGSCFKANFRIGLQTFLSIEYYINTKSQRVNNAALAKRINKIMSLLP